MGERTPHLDAEARGVLVGLTASHTRAHVVRAILEGVAFSLKDTFTIFDEMNVPVKSIRLGGGGARSPLWRQIQADVYGHEVEIVEAEEGAAYGAAHSRRGRCEDLAVGGCGLRFGGTRCRANPAQSGERRSDGEELCSVSANLSSDEVYFQCVAAFRRGEAEEDQGNTGGL